MQTLGLSSESKRSDGWVKSLFWPSVDNAWDVDYLGQQGMWICTLVAVSTLVLSIASGNIVVIFVGILSALFYLLGGMGVRQVSLMAAAMVFFVYVLDTLVQAASFEMRGVLRIIFAAVLLSNLRATFLASRWKPVAEGEDRPTRFAETWSDKFVDQMPAKLWPALQIPFIILGICMILFTLLAIGILVANRLGLMPHR